VKKRLGLLAGKGSLPLEFLKSAEAEGYETVTFALEGITDREVEDLSGKVFWIKPFKLGTFLKLLKREKLPQIAILGKVEHRVALSFSGFDLKAITFILSLKDRRPETIIKGIISEIEKAGTSVVDPTPFLSHLLTEPGVMAGKLTFYVQKDVELGMKVAKELASLDVGQTVVVKDGTVVAVEGIEGTDECIKRGASLAGKGFTVCKAARKSQDMRVDVPTLGIDTVKLVASLGGKTIAFESRKTFLLDREQVVKFAEERGINIVSV